MCTTVCPTECLVHTPVSDFSEFDRSNMLYHFGNLTRLEAEAKRKKLAEIQAKAQVEKESKAAEVAKAAAQAPPKAEQKTDGE